MERIKLTAVDVGTPSPHFETVAEFTLEQTETVESATDPVWMTPEIKAKIQATKMFVIKDAKVPLPNGSSLSVYALYSTADESEASCHIWIGQGERKILDVATQLNVSGHSGKCNPIITLHLEDGVRISFHFDKEIITDV